MDPSTQELTFCSHGDRVINLDLHRCALGEVGPEDADLGVNVHHDCPALPLQK